MTSLLLMFRPAFVLLLFSVLVPALGLAQRVRWEPPGGSFALRQTSQLSLIFENCEPDGSFTLPEIPHLALGQPSRGEQSSFNIVNGEASRTKTVYFTYPVRPTERQTINIPAFTVQTDAGPLQVAPATFEVGEATVGNSSVPLDSAANSQLTVGRGHLWAGEVVPVNYTLSVASRFPANFASGPNWNPSPLVVEEWSRPEPGTALVNGENRNTVTYRSRGYIRDAGTHVIESINQLVNLRVPSAGFNIFQAFQAEQYTITSNSPQVVVRPLPAPAPAGFNGAVGQFELSSRVVPQQAAVGEPITWTLELKGTGNWPDIGGLPPREVSRDFRVVQPQANRTAVEGTLFEASLVEDVVLIPTRPGAYRLGPVTWSYFDPASGRYQTIETEPVTLQVAPAATPSPGTGTTGTDSLGAGEPADSPAVRAAPAPDAPTRIPRDPLPAVPPVSVPWSGPTLAWWILAPFALIPLVWLGLAGQRARANDPGRPAREARRRLGRTLAALRSARDQADQQRLLLAWQRDAVTLWSLRRAAPGATAFSDDPVWVQLWQESERALYGSTATLPADWVERAEQAWARRRAPRFRASRVFHPANLLPVVAVALALAGVELQAQEPGQAYAQGDFAAAEQGWRRQVTEAPTDWAAHHNLALALAQQQRWAEAAAHAAAALVQQPGNPSVRWHYGYTLARAGYTPRALAPFAEPDLPRRLALLQSPVGWQRIAVAAAWAFVAAAVLALLAAFGRIGTAGRWTAGLVAALAVASGVSAGFSLHQYDIAADPRCVLVWRTTTLRSLPTEVAPEQETATLAAGSLAIVDEAFLGWRRLSFPNGQTGWVRAGDFLALWQSARDES